MKFSVCYIDDQATTAVLHASQPELAARQFLALHPRADASQITVVSVPSAPFSQPVTTHFRACDLNGTPAPPDVVGEEALAFRIVDSGYPDFVRSFVITGSVGTFRLLATHLLETVSANSSYTVPVTPADGSHCAHCLRFDPDADPARLWTSSATVRTPLHAGSAPWDRVDRRATPSATRRVFALVGAGIVPGIFLGLYAYFLHHAAGAGLVLCKLHGRSYIPETGALEKLLRMPLGFLLIAVLLWVAAAWRLQSR
jgi:hypothetical protein